jgi:NAD(P)-dependent dehydrogenase (short-subunit alcohol dehydrogenase family)
MAKAGSHHRRFIGYRRGKPRKACWRPVTPSMPGRDAWNGCGRWQMRVRGLLELDVTDDTSMTTAVKAVLQEAGRIDVLINNAGYGSYGALEDVPLDEGRRQFDVNIFGLARLIQLVLPTMRAQRSGRIVNVSSIGGEFGEPFGSWYHATKFAVEGLSDSLRMELHPFGIDVVAIQPGAILTEWNRIARDGLMKYSGNGAYR